MQNIFFSGSYFSNRISNCKSVTTLLFILIYSSNNICNHIVWLQNGHKLVTNIIIYNATDASGRKMFAKFLTIANLLQCGYKFATTLVATN